MNDETDDHDEIYKYLESLYTDTKGSGSFGGAVPLYRAVRDEGVYKLTLNDVKEFLSGRDEYTLHKRIFHKFPTQHIIIGGPNDTVQIDLIDMGKGSAKYNEGVTFILTLIDCFSKYAHAVPLKNKTGDEIVRALGSIYDNRDKPTTIISDAGKEFTNVKTQEWFKQKNIQFHIAFGTHKGQFIERFNRSLKSLVSKYMTLHNTLKYIDVLDDMVHAYNTRYHSSTGYRPVDVNETNAKDIFIKMYGSPDGWFKNLKEPKVLPNIFPERRDSHRTSNLLGYIIHKRITIFFFTGGK